MRNTTKLKNLLQLYSVSFDMDDEGNFHLTMNNKKDHTTQTVIDKTYTVVVEKAFRSMVKKIREETNERD
ncbi:MAG TPA: hypothetical protein VII99_05880 [Bacteroidia bacterium]